MFVTVIDCNLSIVKLALCSSFEGMCINRSSVYSDFGLSNCAGQLYWLNWSEKLEKVKVKIKMFLFQIRESYILFFSSV